MSGEFDGLKALVVDDYESMRKRLVNVLEQLGCETAEAANGFEAMTALRENAFDLLFTDIVMPEMDGFELCEEVRKTPELLDMGVIVVSTHYDTNYIIKALRLGADDYLPKPIELDLVRRVIARVLTPTLQGANDG